MSHPIRDQIEAARSMRCRQRTDVLIFVLVVSLSLSLLATVALQAPPGWFPL